MKRHVSPNMMLRRPSGFTLKFLRAEYTLLKRNFPGASGAMGGYQNTENWVLDTTDPRTLRCPLPPVMFERIIRYCMPGYGSGGPNGRLRAACIPALERLGIYLRRPSDDDNT